MEASQLADSKTMENNFAEKFHRRVAESPNAMAIQFRDQNLSYAQLLSRIKALDSELGSMKGIRVIILLPDSLETYLLHLFLFLNEALAVPLSVQLNSSRIRSVIDC